MEKPSFPPELIEILKSVTNKRARIVIDYILENGFITTEVLEKEYGYNHPPRAARDVREAGIPLETFRVKSSDGRSIAAYRFGDLSKINRDKLEGRTIFPKTFKDELLQNKGSRCFICFGHFEPLYLQVDHRIPYEISGDNNTIERDIDEYMLLCGSCNRAKSWSCEHCANWKIGKSPEICEKCYWGNPETYNHIALRRIRRTDIVWDENELEKFERLRRLAEKIKVPLPDYVKEIISKYLDKSETV